MIDILLLALVAALALLPVGAVIALAFRFTGKVSIELNLGGDKTREARLEAERLRVLMERHQARLDKSAPADVV